MPFYKEKQALIFPHCLRENPCIRGEKKKGKKKQRVFHTVSNREIHRKVENSVSYFCGQPRTSRSISSISYSVEGFSRMLFSTVLIELMTVVWSRSK